MGKRNFWACSSRMILIPLAKAQGRLRDLDYKVENRLHLVACDIESSTSSLRWIGEL